MADQAAQGALTIDNTAPASAIPSRPTSTINDFEGVTLTARSFPAPSAERGDIPLQDLSFQWQYQIIAAPGGTSQWVDIAGATGPTFAPTDFYVGIPLRVVASFTDGLGVNGEGVLGADRPPGHRPSRKPRAHRGHAGR